MRAQQFAQIDECGQCSSLQRKWCLDRCNRHAKILTCAFVALYLTAIDVNPSELLLRILPALIFVFLETFDI